MLSSQFFPMRNILFLACFLVQCFVWQYSHAQAPVTEWQKTLGGGANEQCYSAIQTADGGYALAGYTYSSDGDVTGQHGMHDVWVVKLSCTGALQWQRTYGGTNSDYGWSIIQTFDGGYAVAGSTESNDGDVNGNHGVIDVWVLKLTGSGGIEWQRTLGGSVYEQANSIVQTADSGFVIAGYTTSTDGDITLNHGNEDFWVVKLSTTGVLQWEKTYGGTNNDRAYSIINTSDGGYAVTGYATSNNYDVVGSHGSYEFWVIKISSTGVLQWQKPLGGNSAETGRSIIQTIDGGYVAAGYTQSNNGDVSGNQGGNDYWVVKLDATGSIEWQRCLGGTDEDIAFSVVQDADTGYTVLGYSRSIDGFVTGFQGNYDYWMAKLTVSGSLLWQKAVGGSDIDYGLSLISTRDGGHLTAGVSYSSNGNVTGQQGNGDFWAVKFAPTHTATILPLATTIFCPTTNFNMDFTSIGIFGPGNTYTVQWSDVTGNFSNPDTIGSLASTANSGTINVVLPANATAGSSYRIRILTSNPPNTGKDNGTDITISATSGSISKSLCSGETYFFNNQYLDAGGIYTDTLTNAGGCDSILTLTLTVNNISFGTFNESICAGSSFLFNNQNLTSAGSYLDTLVNAAGCDSFITLILIVNDPIVDTVSHTICYGELFEGYTVSGTFTDMFTTAGGCDSLRTLILTVLPYIGSTDSAIICNGERYFVGGAAQAVSGTYYDTITLAGGCDSIVSTILTVYPTPAIPIVQRNGNVLSIDSFGVTGIQWFLWVDNIAGATNATHTVTENGIYYVVVFNSFNCLAVSDTLMVTGVGVAHLDNDWGIQYFPNPTDNLLFVDVQGIANADYTLFNSLGQAVAQGTLEKGYPSTLKLGAFPDGMYHIKVQAGNEVITKKVFLVK
ncbi:hypothetical protein BH09BAC1_BH09BAC1_12460 [soil metagenome]